MEPIFVPYHDWCKEAEQVAQEDLHLFGFCLSSEGIMRHAHDYIVRIQEDGNMWLWAGWQQAMRKNRERREALRELTQLSQELGLYEE